MTDFTSLYREFDPLRPLDAGDALYVDWQQSLDPGGADVKRRLANEFARNATPERTITRLLTGHKGSGKTTELNRVRGALTSGERGKKVFVSTLFAARWLDLEDVQPEDLVLQVVRQLVVDLDEAGVSLAEPRFKTFLASVVDKFKSVRVESTDIGIDPLSFSFALKDFPSGRSEFRDVLRGQLPTVFDLVNRELLPAARAKLTELGYNDVLLIVDDLDKIPQKVVGNGRITNHESLFLDNSSTLRALDCSQLLTIPIELAYSPAQGRLRDDYGSAIFTVPIVSVATRDGVAVRAGIDSLIEVVGLRARAATGETVEARAAAAALFNAPAQLETVVRLSGGHLRGLLVMITEMLGYLDELPITQATIDRYAARTGRDLGRALYGPDKAILRRVADTGDAVDDARFFELLRNQYVFAYEAGEEDYWYGLNPLLREIVT